MTGSLKDQLLALGFKPAPKPASTPGPRGDQGQGRGPGATGGTSGKAPQRPGPGKSADRRGDRRPAKPGHAAQTAAESYEIDLAKAYALRAKAEREEKERLAREAAEKARQKAERKAKVAALLEGAALNLADAEHPRHFEYGGKIRRVYVDEGQLAAINRGELGVVQHKGRFLIVTRDMAVQVHAIEPALLALLVDPDALSPDDVPPDLV